MAFTLDIGDQAPDFSLPAVDGHDYSLASFAKYRILVVTFMCNHCPFVTGSLARINALQERYRERDVKVVGINSNETDVHVTDSFDHMVALGRDHRLTFPYLRDGSQQIALKYGALKTPHFFVFGPERKLLYTGRLDDNPKNPGKETTHELADALDEVLADMPVRRPKTNPIGCNVKWKDREAHWMPPEACDLV